MPFESVTLKSTLRPFVAPLRDRWRSWRPNLAINEKDFSGFREPLKSAMVNVARTRFHDREDHKTIPGWMRPRERQMLYAMGRWLPGPVLEIGSWLGLSTTAIARGIRDSGISKRFDTIDLKLTTDNFVPTDGGIGLFLPGDPKSHGVCSKRSYETEVFPFISAPGGSNRILRDNLKRLELSQFVAAHIGDFRSWPHHLCGWVFCDALHDLHEIEINAPHLRSFLGRESVVACHDVGGKPDLIAALRKILPLGHGISVDTLYVAETLTEYTR